MTSLATAQEIINALIRLREERADLDAQEQFLKRTADRCHGAG